MSYMNDCQSKAQEQQKKRIAEEFNDPRLDRGYATQGTGCLDSGVIRNTVPEKEPATFCSTIEQDLLVIRNILQYVEVGQEGLKQRLNGVSTPVSGYAAHTEGAALERIGAVLNDITGLANRILDNQTFLNNIA